jgi:hypothetical protein
VHFVNEYIHWLDLSTGELEFRPTGSVWTPSSSNWRLYIRKPGIHPRAMLQKPSKDANDSPIQVIDIRSSTFVLVSGLLSPLESPEHIIVTHTILSLEVSLPRLRLSFFVNSNWELECRSIPGYIIDTHQPCGTMVGLRNKLVLCPCPSSLGEPLPSRRVIVPEGEISFNTDGDFSNVSIKTDSGQHIRWHEYTIDADLGCLTNNTSLSSKLYQCYLHALTSHCLPDPLLGHTGTKEALYILRSAACRSFQRLDAHEAKLLELIGKLSPEGGLHRSTIANVKWNDLPALSQHHDFFPAVHSILDHAVTLETLYDQPTVFETPPARDQIALNRTASRNKIYFPSDFHISEPLTFSSDVEYRSRDLTDVSDLGIAEHVAFQTSWSIWNGRPSLDPGLPELWDLMHSWGSLGPNCNSEVSLGPTCNSEASLGSTCNSEVSLGPTCNSEVSLGPTCNSEASLGPTCNSEASLRYNRYWLEFDAARDWFVIYNLCRKPVNKNRRNLRIELSFCLSAAAFRRSRDSDIVPFAIIFALDEFERYRSLSPPSDHSYTLSDGLVPSLTRLEDLVSRCARPGTVRRESEVVAESILHQWPDYQSVHVPKQWFYKSRCKRQIKQYFQSISRNFRLKEHVLHLQVLLYGNVTIPTAAVPYVFLPQFITSNTKAPSYSLCDVLASRTNFQTQSTDVEPFQCLSMFPPTPAIEGITPPPASGCLETLIEELQDSRRPLLQLYGNELNKSRHELLGLNVFRSVRDAVPSHEVLLLYHKECSNRKDKLFSEIFAALSPLQNVEETSRIAGLWPHITPRSLLRQLARDRISTLPGQWKFVITRYAVSFLMHQQSLRMLELSSRQKSEELLREIEAICHDVLAKSTPDWLLVQVRPLLFRRR